MQRATVISCVGLLAGALALTAAGVVRAQAPAGAMPSFEVASVKPNTSGERFVRLQIQPGGRFNAVNVPLREIIRAAYQLQNFQILNLPRWGESDRFDIVAKAESDFPQGALPGSPGPLQFMLQSLLADRFQLKAHRDTQELPIYALVLARGDGRLGERLASSATDCAGPGARRGAPPPALVPGQRPGCGMRIGPGTISAGGTSLAQFANGIAPMVGRVVVDRTGLTGNFDIDLEWTPDQIPQGGPPGAGGPPVGADLPPVDPNGPSIFTAVQEQLGLKLDSARGPVEVLVIDSVSPPTPD